MFGLLLTTPNVSNPDALETLIKVILAAGIAAYVMCIAWYVLQVIANWRIFTKAGEKGWKSIIFLNPIFLLILGLGGSQYQSADR